VPGLADALRRPDESATGAAAGFRHGERINARRGSPVALEHQHRLGNRLSFYGSGPHGLVDAIFGLLLTRLVMTERRHAACDYAAAHHRGSPPSMMMVSPG